MPRDAITNHEITDEDLARMVTEALAWDSRIHYSRIRVTADAGVVFLAGTVECMVEKVAAEEDAGRISGVTQIVSNILVSPERPVTDADIKKSVEDALSRDARVSGGHFEVEVQNRVVTLRGEVLMNVHRRAAIDDAQITYGVQGVVDQIAVLPQQAESDHMLEELVTADLARTANVDENRIHAHVEGGVVHLKGTADFLYQRQMAERAVEDTPGVGAIENEITVTGPTAT